MKQEVRSNSVIAKQWDTVNKSELILRLSEKLPGLCIEDTKFAVNNILEQMFESLSSGKRIEIRGFGAFSLSYRPPHISHNPKTGEKFSTPARYIPRFKVGQELRDRVKNKGM